MNVVRGGNCSTLNTKNKNDLVRKEQSGIRGNSIVLPTFKSYKTTASKVPRYQFDKNNVSKGTSNTMGPPLETPRSLKRKLVSSSSGKHGSSSSVSKIKILALDSNVETTQEFTTPKNRPNALRYIGSSSRGGHSGSRSARSTSMSAAEASVILAISEGRGMARGEIGMAAVDLKHPNLVLCQFSDTLLYNHTLSKINYFNPIEIVVPHTFCEGVQPNQLYKLIKEQFPQINVTTVQRRHFNDAAGRLQIQTLCAPQYSAVYLQVMQKFYALTAAAAVLKYVEYIQCIVFARESLKIQYHSSESTMIIDVGTATQLELVQPLVPSAGATCCLLGVLGPTYTIGGIRALRASILQPSYNKTFIETRLDAVQDLIENSNGLMSALQDVIKKLSEIDKILFLCVESPNQNLERTGESQLNQTLLLKTSMEMVPLLVDALNYAESGRLRKIKMDFENPHYKEILDRIRKIIQDDAHLEKGAMGSLQRCFAVKPEINGLLDVARRTYSELIEDIQKLVESLSETYDIPIRLNQNMLKGFHIVLPIAPKNRNSFNAQDLPECFIQVQSSGASVTMSTEELVVMDQQAKEALHEIQKMSNIVIAGLLHELRPFMSSLYTLCENIAELDILIALAHASTVGSYIRPEFDDYLCIRNGVHPLLDYNSQHMPVPNDINASAEQNFTIITGPNMGGKSIYIKQVAVLHVMAQVGCFVPATKAVIRLCDRIFSRIGFNDSVEINASTFVLEMKEMQHIIKGLTSSSLVIIDELCRGTNTEEGTSIAWAISEELLLSEAFTFFTTHFMYLTRLQDLYYNVVNLHTVVAEEIEDSSTQTKRLIYQHRIEPGVTKVQHYGLALASKSNLPEETVKLAEELAELIATSMTPQPTRIACDDYEKAIYDLNIDIRKAVRSNIDSNADDMAKILQNAFKDKHPEIIDIIKNDRDSNKFNNRKNNLSSDRQDSSINLGIADISHFDDNVEIELRSKTSSNNHNLVKSSNELLNTIIKPNERPQYNEISSDSSTADSNNHNVLARESSSSDDMRKKKIPKFRPPLKISDSETSRLTDVTSKTIKDNSIDLTRETHQIIPNEIPPIDNDYIDLDNVTLYNKNTPNIHTPSNKSSIVEDISMCSSTKTSQANSFMQDFIELSDSDTDIAEALTQVIEDNSSSGNISITDTDVDLMKEALEEIADDVHSIVLTPPFEFRD